MRVAILGSRGYPSTYGGFETFVRRFAPYLHDHGDDVTVYGRVTGVRTHVDTIDGIRTVTTPGLDRKSVSTLLSGLTSGLHAWSERYDAVLVLNCANGPWLPILWSRGIPAAVNVDGIEWERDKWGTAGKAMFRLGASTTARFADRIIVDSVEIGRIWRERFGVPSTFIPYGAEVVSDLGSGLLRTHGIEPGSYVLVVARLVPENNVDLLLSALDRLDAGIPAVIVGSANYDSPVDRQVGAFLARHPRAIALGHVHDQDLLAQLWAHCAVYFHGHSVGGTNPALLQALGFGSPTLALDTPFNREVLDAPEQLVPHDPAVVADRIREVLEDPTVADRYRDHGRAVVAERYSWETVCRHYRDVLVELADTRRR